MYTERFVMFDKNKLYLKQVEVVGQSLGQINVHLWMYTEILSQMITFQRNWCISISNDNLTNLCHDRIVIFIIGHVFPPSYLSMRIHHVRGKVLQTGPKLQLTERMSDACVSVTFVVSLQVCHNSEIEN